MAITLPKTLINIDAVFASSIAEQYYRQQRRWMRPVNTRWGNRWCIRHRRIWEDPMPNVPSTEKYSKKRMSREKLDQLTPINPVWQSRRIPLMGYKVGSMNLWDEWGERHCVTIVKVRTAEASTFLYLYMPLVAVLFNRKVTGWKLFFFCHL